MCEDAHCTVVELEGIQKRKSDQWIVLQPPLQRLYSLLVLWRELLVSAAKVDYGGYQEDEDEDSCEEQDCDSNAFERVR